MFCANCEGDLRFHRKSNGINSLRLSGGWRVAGGGCPPALMLSAKVLRQVSAW